MVGTISKAKVGAFLSYLSKRRSPATVASYRSVLDAYVDTYGNSWSKNNLLSFIESRSSSYSRLSHYALKKFAKHAEITFPLDEDDLLPLSKDVSRPVVNPGEMVKIIDWVKAHGSPSQKLYFALASTFGFRREELASINPNTINGSIIVQAEKHGELREHAIPEQIQPYILKDTRKYSGPGLHTLYRSTLNSAGVGLANRCGFHSIRRALDGGLLKAGVPILYVKKFMGWKLSSMEKLLGMPGFYAANSIDREDVDRVVFEKHPFLGLWV